MNAVNASLLCLTLCVDVGEGSGHRGKGALNSYPLMLLNVFVFNFHLRLLLVCVYRGLLFPCGAVIMVVIIDSSDTIVSKFGW